jgi:ADP-ribose pyrophosphatase YjhB (NUDIX family)
VGFPSGFIEEGESAAEACVRELSEETGLSGTIVKLIRVARVEDNEIYGDMLAVVYLVRVNEGEPVAGEEVEETRFVEKSELPEFYRRLYPDIIEQVHNGMI